MKKVLFVLLMTSIVMSVLRGNSRATPITITDTYIGASPTHPSWYGKDIIGDPNYFDVSRMEVGFSGNQMIVTVYSSYFDNIGQYGTQLGDLFISTNGYHPHTPTADDNYLNGEKWEYVVALDNHLGTSGTTSLYALNGTGDIRLSSAPSGYIYRAQQEVQYKGTGSSLGAGSWFVNPTQGYLTITMLMLDGWNNIPEFGFHWTMTCANDVIEGGVSPAPVPEPGTMFLLGSGLVAIAALGRKRFTS